MGPARIIVLVVAVVAMIGVFVLVRAYVAGSKPKPGPAVATAAVPPPQPMTQVLVAAKDLAPGAVIAEGDLTWQPWPANSVNPAYKTNGPAPEGAADKAAGAMREAVGGSPQIEAYLGAVVREKLASGEPIVEGKLVRGGEGGYLAVTLAPGMRAMSVPATVETAARGFILPGDRVDVLQNREVADGRREAQVVLRNVKVLGINQRASAEKDIHAYADTQVATLEVSAEAAEALAAARGRGDMMLALRSYADAHSPSGPPQSAVVQSEPSTVRIFRNGEVEEVTVSR